MRTSLEKKMAQKEKEAKENKLSELAQRASKDRARQRNLERAAPERRSKLEKERDRDISEQIALGMPAKTTTSGEGMFDARLFNQSKGMDSGFNDDENYGVYDQPWRKEGNLANNIYRPSKNIDAEMYGGQEDLEALRKEKRFVPDKEFSGTSGAGGSGRTGATWQIIFIDP